MGEAWRRMRRWTHTAAKNHKRRPVERCSVRTENREGQWAERAPRPKKDAKVPPQTRSRTTSGGGATLRQKHSQVQRSSWSSWLLWLLWLFQTHVNGTRYVHNLLRTNCAGALDNEELFVIKGSENWRSTPGQHRPPPRPPPRRPFAGASEITQEEERRPRSPKR